MEERKYGCQGEVKANTGDYDKWYEKNKWLIKPLGLSRNDAYFLRGTIDPIAKRLGDFYWKSILPPSCALIPFLLYGVCEYWANGNVKWLYFVAFLSGGIGALYASFGIIILYYMGLLSKGKFNIVYPSSSQIDKEQWTQIEQEIKRNLLLIIGGVCLLISFVLQMLLQFVLASP